MRKTDAPAPNRAQRRAAARGKEAAGGPGVPAPRAAGPRERTKPVHTRTDYAARRSG